MTSNVMAKQAVRQCSSESQEARYKRTGTLPQGATAPR